jgi:hypothetical protein
MSLLLLPLPEVDDHAEAALELAAEMGWSADPQRPDRWQLAGTCWRLRVHLTDTWVYELHEGYYRHRLRVPTANLYALKLTLERVAANCITVRRAHAKECTLHAGHPARY